MGTIKTRIDAGVERVEVSDAVRRGVANMKFDAEPFYLSRYSRGSMCCVAQPSNMDEQATELLKSAYESVATTAQNAIGK
ncbi:hypothetical protein FACS1894103_0720 [Campylobacterota bacterium]|nr:hypothetical protein FACS1894103_0390 [Campylobacterota bacterium]GHV58729.1 hypothetical protein FACS1894103_0720 [Campylobacterota bacterium]